MCACGCSDRGAPLDGRRRPEFWRDDACNSALSTVPVDGWMTAGAGAGGATPAPVEWSEGGRAWWPGAGILAELRLSPSSLLLSNDAGAAASAGAACGPPGWRT